jgi:SNF2 family DNA or RNA helicase
MSKELFEGQAISAPFLSEEALVKNFEIKSGYYLLEVIFITNKTYKKLHINEDQLQQIRILETDEFDYLHNSEEFFLWIEANRLRLAHQFDNLLAVSVSKVDPLPHQIEAVYSYILRDPHIRFLIADDAGAGKTIMAGLTIKELQYRMMANRIIIVCPGHLKYQWQREMKEKFDIQFRIIDRGAIDTNWGTNIWEDFNHIIASIDFLKRKDIITGFQSTLWDFAIVDEAHKMSAYSYPIQKGKRIEKTRRYMVGEVLSTVTTHMLFLTATPHRGDKENFRLFLDLLRPGFFSKTEILKESIDAQENPLFVRRLKEDMTTFDGRKIFPNRNVITVTFKLSSPERNLYNEVTNYVRHHYNKAKERRSITFAMLILQRRLTSSINSVLKSLENRKKRLEKLLSNPELINAKKEPTILNALSQEDFEDMEEEERWKLEEKLERLTLAKNIIEVKEEITKLDELLLIAKEVKDAEIESKLTKLRDDVLSKLEGRKLVIFTEFRDTLDYLLEKMTEWGYKVGCIHGNMKMEERIDAEKKFKNDNQILVATEAAGEGINLQFCSWMVNYDIPWNPNRLEQRMGRIHRYGQDKEVFIFNMVSRDTREGQILEIIFDKLIEMKEELGSDRVFDIVGEIIPDTDLEDVLKEAVVGQKTMDELCSYVEEIDKAKMEKTLSRVFMSGLATRHVDYSSVLRKIQRSEEKKLIPEYVEDYLLRALKILGTAVNKTENYCRINNVPFDLRKSNDNLGFRSKYGKISKRYNKITFNKEIAKQNPDMEYIAPGHPLLEGINELILSKFAQRNKIAVFADPKNEKEGILWFIIGEITDGMNNVAEKRMFCIYEDVRGKRSIKNSGILWDFTPIDTKSHNIHLDTNLRNLLQNEENIEEIAVNEVLFPFHSELKKKRDNISKIKEKYGLRSIDYLLQESNNKLINYQLQEVNGRDMKLAILNEERRKEDLENKRNELSREIELGKNLAISDCSTIGIAIILPAIRFEGIESSIDHDVMSTDKVIERIGMEVAIEYEINQDRHVEDVHTDDLGFDIRSTKFDPNGNIMDVRYIEVKARSREGAIRLSSNEWKKAKHLGEKYWLYVVTFAGTDNPKLSERIQNPASRFKLDENIYASGYIIPFRSISQTKQKV